MVCKGDGEVVCKRWCGHVGVDGRGREGDTEVVQGCCCWDPGWVVKGRYRGGAGVLQRCTRVT